MARKWEGRRVLGAPFARLDRALRRRGGAGRTGGGAAIGHPGTPPPRRRPIRTRAGGVWRSAGPSRGDAWAGGCNGLGPPRDGAADRGPRWGRMSRRVRRASSARRLRHGTRRWCRRDRGGQARAGGGGPEVHPEPAGGVGPRFRAPVGSARRPGCPRRPRTPAGARPLRGCTRTARPGRARSTRSRRCGATASGPASPPSSWWWAWRRTASPSPTRATRGGRTWRASTRPHPR